MGREIRETLPLLYFNEVRMTLRLFVPRFLFDSLSQYPLSVFREYWDKLSNYLIAPSEFSLNKEKTAKQFTKRSYLVGKWRFCHSPPILAQWRPYIAKYP